MTARLVAKYPVQAAVAALLVLSAIWGYNWVVMKLALRDAGPFTFAALRTGLGTLALFLVLPFRGGVRPPADLRGTAWVSGRGGSTAPG